MQKASTPQNQRTSTTPLDTSISFQDYALGVSNCLRMIWAITLSGLAALIIRSVFSVIALTALSIAVLGGILSLPFALTRKATVFLLLKANLMPFRLGLLTLDPASIARAAQETLAQQRLKKMSEDFEATDEFSFGATETPQAPQQRSKRKLDS